MESATVTKTEKPAISTAAYFDGSSPSAASTSTSPSPTAEAQQTHDAAAAAARFSPLAVIGIAYSVLNSWVAMAGSLSVVLPSGGPSAMIWGLVVSTVGTFAITATMAEVSAVFVSSGGPYHHAFLLAPPHWKRSLSYATGWASTAGWWALTATASSIAGQYITGIISLLHPNYTLQRWHQTLIYWVWTAGAWALNIFGEALLDPINRFSIFWSMTGAALICIVCLARASSGPPGARYQSGEFVFRTLINRTGWPDGVAWILGLLQSAYGLTASDAVTHLCEEMPRPHVNVPRAMLLAVAIGSSSSFVVLVTLLFVLNDFDAVIDSGAGPLLEIIYQATRNKAAAISLLMFPLAAMLFAATGILCASSRQTYTFAKDRGLPFSRFLTHTASPRLGNVPWTSITLTSALVIIFGCIYLGNSTALNAILSSSVVGLQVSYAVPAAILLVRGRGVLDAGLDEALTTDDEVGRALAAKRQGIKFKRRPFDLGVYGYAVNAMSFVFCLVTAAFFLLPAETPITADNMNYTSAVVALVCLVAFATWWLDGRKRFEGPMGLRETLIRLGQDRTELSDPNPARSTA
ncbi:hypothetical protein V8E36_000012 [Tilletia maclaganii]